MIDLTSMTTLNLKIKLTKNQDFPFFVSDKNFNNYFWIVLGPLNDVGYYKAIFLGNYNYHPFQYTGRIFLADFEKIDVKKVILTFD